MNLKSWKIKVFKHCPECNPNGQGNHRKIMLCRECNGLGEIMDYLTVDQLKDILKSID